ncbi:MAG TPA: CBS domain-containing protein [Planctomycetota bacterium]|nr:CBS domain-containing protein [Planctomycetota bacterium]
MKIEQLMTRDVRTVGPDDRLDRAAQLMWEADCGCLPVVDGDQHVVGMITDRDVCMAAWTQGRALCELPVRGAMSSRVISCAPSDATVRAERLMRDHQVRRVPVVDGQALLVGLLSLNDLALAAQPGSGTRDVRPDEVADTLAAVGRRPATGPGDDARQQQPASQPVAARSSLIARG